MLEELKKYHYIKKSNSELEADRIINGISEKLWNNSGCMTAYYLGTVMQLRCIAKALKESTPIYREDILQLISAYKNHEGVSDLVNMILEEFDYKEN